MKVFTYEPFTLSLLIIGGIIIDDFTIRAVNEQKKGIEDRCVVTLKS